MSVREAARTQVTTVPSNVFYPFVLDGETGQRLREAWPTLDHRRESPSCGEKVSV
jgi:hypothetical protein